MRTVTTKQQISENVVSEQVITLKPATSAVRAIRHLPHGSHEGQTRDLISELRANLDLVEDLAFRMRFMTREVSQLVKRSK